MARQEFLSARRGFHVLFPGGCFVRECLGGGWLIGRWGLYEGTYIVGALDWCSCEVGYLSSRDLVRRSPSLLLRLGGLYLLCLPVYVGGQYAISPFFAPRSPQLMIIYLTHKSYQSDLDRASFGFSYFTGGRILSPQLYVVVSHSSVYVAAFLRRISPW